MADPKILTQVERRVLDLLLAGDHPTLAGLRRQARVLTVTDRFFPGSGVDVKLHVPRTEWSVAQKSFTLSDVEYELEGIANGGQAIVFVREGFLSRLILSNWTAAWPSEPRFRSGRYLVPIADNPQTLADERDMVGLARKLPA